MQNLTKTIAYTLPFALSALLLTGCNSMVKPSKTVVIKPAIPVEATYPALPPAKDMTRLKEGQSLAVADTPLTLTFNKVTADDRCPLHAQCIWVGNATVDLTVRDKDGQSQNLALSSGDLRGDLKRKASVFGHTISLETVYPTPTTTGTTLQDLTGKYMIDVKVLPTAK